MPDGKKERNATTCLEKSPKGREVPFQGGQDAGEAGQHSVVLVDDLGGSSKVLCRACSLPSSRKTFPGSWSPGWRLWFHVQGCVT